MFYPPPPGTINVSIGTRVFAVIAAIESSYVKGWPYSPAMISSASLAEGGAKIERPGMPVLRSGIGSSLATAAATLSW
jgi:hypothetical protein